MAKASVFIILALMFLSLLHAGSTLNCYNCTKCNDPFQKVDARIIECSGTCAKAKALTDGPGFKKDDVGRDCLPQTVNTTICEVIGSVLVCFCDTDLCNGSDVKQATIATVIMTLILHLYSFVN